MIPISTPNLDRVLQILLSLDIPGAPYILQAVVQYYPISFTPEQVT